MGTPVKQAANLAAIRALVATADSACIRTTLAVLIPENKFAEAS